MYKERIILGGLILSSACFIIAIGLYVFGIRHGIIQDKFSATDYFFPATYLAIGFIFGIFVYLRTFICLAGISCGLIGLFSIKGFRRKYAIAISTLHLLILMQIWIKFILVN